MILGWVNIFTNLGTLLFQAERGAPSGSFKALGPCVELGIRREIRFSFTGFTFPGEYASILQPHPCVTRVVCTYEGHQYYLVVVMCVVCAIDCNKYGYVKF